MNVPMIMIVDDEEAFLDAFARWLQVISRKELEVIKAKNAGQALTLLKKQVPDVVVVDLQMPVMDGRQLLKMLASRHPKTTRVVLTGMDLDAEEKAVLQEQGADYVLQKPVRVDDYETLEGIFSTLLEVTAPAAPVSAEGFHATLKGVNLGEVIQMQCVAGASCKCLVRSAEQESAIYIRQGLIIHAESGGLSGEEAFYAVLALPGGRLEILDYVEPPQSTIQANFQMLLLEAARRADEAGSEQAASGGDTFEVTLASQTMYENLKTKMQAKEMSFLDRYTDFSQSQP